MTPSLIPPETHPLTVRFAPARIERLRRVAACADVRLETFIEAAAIRACDAAEKAAGRLAPVERER